MNDIDEAIMRAATNAADQDTRLQDIFKEHFGLIPSDTYKPEAGYMAYGMLAVDIAVRLTKMFIAIKRDKGIHAVACDLTYQMNTNEFWQKNASVLLPIMHVCLNTHTDGIQLLAARTRDEDYHHYDALIAGSRAAPLEIFPIIAYLVGGPALMVVASLPLKRDLAPYLLS